MKREFLEKLGLGKEAIGAVMAEHGKSIEELRLRLEQAEGEASAVPTLSEENRVLKETLTKQQEIFTAFRDKVIASLVAEAHPVSALTRSELIRRLCQASEQGEDLKDTLRQLREEDPDAFAKRGGTLPVFSAVCFASEEDSSALSIAMRRR